MIIGQPRIPSDSCVQFMNTVSKTYDYIMAYTNDFGGVVIQDEKNIQHGGIQKLSASQMAFGCGRMSMSGSFINIVNPMK